jgi:hypothetical protein
MDGKDVPATVAVKDGQAEISLTAAVVLKEGEKLTATLA